MCKVTNKELTSIHHDVVTFNANTGTTNTVSVDIVVGLGAVVLFGVINIHPGRLAILSTGNQRGRVVKTSLLGLALADIVDEAMSRISSGIEVELAEEVVGEEIALEIP